MQLKPLGKLKIKFTSSDIEPATFRLVASTTTLMRAPIYTCTSAITEEPLQNPLACLKSSSLYVYILKSEIKSLDRLRLFRDICKLRLQCRFHKFRAESRTN
jgi:hypothetical protein